jgi:hypothetical protein
LKRCLGLRGLITATSLLLPLWAAAESHVHGGTGTGAGTATGKVSAAAHVDFRIVIPKVLSLGIAGGDTQGLGAQRVAIYSNSRTVTLAASAGSMPAARSNVILRAAAGKVIAREAACQLPTDASSRGSPMTNGMICTVSMP